MTKEPPHVQHHHVPLVGLPQATDWISQFAAISPAIMRPASARERLMALGHRRFAWLPHRRPPRSVHPVRDSPAWSALAAGLLATHRQRAGLDPAALDQVDHELAQLIRKIDTTVSAVVDIPPHDVGIGELLSRMAARWVTYAASPDAGTGLGVLKAQRDYNTRIEQLPLLRAGTR